MSSTTPNPAGLPAKRIKLLWMSFSQHHTCRTCGERMPPDTTGYNDMNALIYEQGFYCEFCAGSLIAAGAAKEV